MNVWKPGGVQDRIQKGHRDHQGGGMGLCGHPRSDPAPRDSTTLPSLRTRQEVWGPDTAPGTTTRDEEVGRQGTRGTRRCVKRFSFSWSSVTDFGTVTRRWLKTRVCPSKGPGLGPKAVTEVEDTPTGGCLGLETGAFPFQPSDKGPVPRRSPREPVYEGSNPQPFSVFD